MECTRDDDNLCLLFYNRNIFLSPFLFLMHLATRCTCWNHLSLYFSLSSLRQTFIGVFKHLLSPFLSRRKIDFGSNACEDSNPNRFGEKFVLEMWKQVLPWKSYEFKMSQFRISREICRLCPNCSVIRAIRATISDAAIQPIYRPFPSHVPLSMGCQRSLPLAIYIVDESVTKVDSQGGWKRGEKRIKRSSPTFLPASENERIEKSIVSI